MIVRTIIPQPQAKLISVQHHDTQIVLNTIWGFVKTSFQIISYVMFDNVLPK